MFKYLVGLAALLFCSSACAQCLDVINSLEIGLGWRRDTIDWKIKHMHQSQIDAEVDSHIFFKDINYYTIDAKVHSVGSEYYFRASAYYGLSDKGRAKERFQLTTPLYDIGELSAFHTDERIKRRSEVYDFSGAIGYPFTFCCCRLMVAPLIGFSFHRQHIRSKRNESIYSDSSFVYERSGVEAIPYSSFEVDSSNPFDFSYSSSDFANSDPFSSPSPVDIASELGLSVEKRTSPYRFTWYGFYTGADIYYALDSYWTIFSQTEFHFLNRCHRKRKSLTGVFFVDDYHHEGFAYGFDQKVGVNFEVGSCYYASICVDYKWWKGHCNHDTMHWDSVGVNVALGYAY